MLKQANLSARIRLKWLLKQPNLVARIGVKSLVD